MLLTDTLLNAPTSLSGARLNDGCHWAIILAGGDGVRLRSLTRDLSGDDRPKQFCKIFGNETLLQQTQRRIAHLIRPERTVVVVNRKHAQYFDADLAEHSVLTQPENRGTAAAILYGLVSVGTRDPEAHVALFPADHYFANDAKFMEHVDHAFHAVRQHPNLVILLGIVPDGPEIDYGWIQPGRPVRGVGSVLSVQQFWEKPPQIVAEELLVEGCLWNSFVVVASVHSLIGLMRKTVPELCDAFHDAGSFLRKPADIDMVKAIYSKIPSVDFSRQVLTQCPDLLSVLPLAGAGWIDVGVPERVRAAMIRKEVRQVGVCR